MDWAYLDHPRVVPIAHRGGAGDAPENSLAAFQAAVDLGYRYIETDVHATADGVLVAFHDDRLERVTDRVGPIAELDWSAVSRARIAGREPIPRLEEVLTSFPDARIAIDPKRDAAVEPLVACLRRCRAVDRVCVGSFSDRRLATVRDALGPRLCTGLGPRAAIGLGLASLGVPVRRLRGAVAQLPLGSLQRRGAARLVAEAHRRGLAVHVWTVDEAADMHRLVDIGVDGIMTDRPAVLKTVLEARQMWPS